MLYRYLVFRIKPNSSVELPRFTESKYIFNYYRGKPMAIELSPKQYQTRLNWDDARVYCFSMNIDGSIGWRLPTIDEITALNLNGGFYWCLQDQRAENYWYSSTNSMNHLPYDPDTYAPALYGTRLEFDLKDEENIVRPVRTI